MNILSDILELTVEECRYHDAQARLAETRQVKADVSSEYTNIDYQIRPTNPTSCTRPKLETFTPLSLRYKKSEDQDNF